MIQIKNLTFSYSRGKQPVIDGLSVQIGAGGIYGLLGLNGSGKTTLLNIIAGMLTPDSGNAEFKGIDTRRRCPSTLGDMFLMPEEFTLPSVKIREYVNINRGFYPRFSDDDMKSHLAAFGINETEKPGCLSMGQRKKVLLSFALACNTSLLLLDEPTNGLDLPGKKALRSILASSIDDTRTVILSTHQIADISNIIDHVIIMNKGRTQVNASIAEIASAFRFELTASPAVIKSALYKQPVFNGYIAILPNEDGTESEIDLESFFYFCMEKPDIIAGLI